MPGPPKKRDLVGLFKPPKPYNQMTPEERRAWARRVAEAARDRITRPK